MSDILNTLSYLTSAEQMQANYEKYKDNFKDANSEIVNSETFLSLLVAEMTNQDPLEPTSNTEFVTQMAQFTQLQYSQDSSTYSKANYASNLVGKIATASKQDGNDILTKTGVVEKVVKTGKDYTVYIEGVAFDISKVSAVEENTKQDNNTNDIIGSMGAGSLGSTIASASMMVGMYATVNASTASGDVMDAGYIEAIQVKDGVVNVVINNISYKLDDIVDLRYGTVTDGNMGNESGDTTVDTEEEQDAPAVESTTESTQKATESADDAYAAAMERANEIIEDFGELKTEADAFALMAQLMADEVIMGDVEDVEAPAEVPEEV